MSLRTDVLDMSFYASYYGHTEGDLIKLVSYARRQNSEIIWLAGDSVLDNKYWVYEFNSPVPSRLCGVFAKDMRCCPDIAYWMNLLDENQRRITINCAVEEATITSKERNLNCGDRCIIDNIEKKDTLIVNLGGNDVALEPSFITLASIFTLLFFVPAAFWPYLRWTPPLIHLQHVFKKNLETYVQKLILRKAPKDVVLCTIYYPDKSQEQKSWARYVLKIASLSGTHKLDRLIDFVHDNYTSAIKLDAPCRVHYLPLSTVLDGSNGSDYVQRVEPSMMGGRNLAQAFLRVLGNSFGEWDIRHEH